MRVLLASPLGFLIGVALGAVGGGGSILAVPALVYAAGLEPQRATTASLVIVGATALAGLPAQVRARHVKVVAGIGFALAGVAGSVLGTRVNEQLDPDVLLLAFAALMVLAAFAMARRAHTTFATVEVTTDNTGTPTGMDTPAHVAWSADGAPTSATLATRGPRVNPVVVLKVLGAGTVVGFLTGTFGVGGGFVIVPALVLALGFEMPVAAGTSLLVIALNSAIALVQRADGAPLAWNAILAFGIAAVPGVMVGTRLARTVEPRRLTTWFVVLLLGVATYTAVRSTVALVTG